MWKDLSRLPITNVNGAFSFNGIFTFLVLCNCYTYYITPKKFISIELWNKFRLFLIVPLGYDIVQIILILAFYIFIREKF